MGEVWLARLERAINGAIVAEVAVQPAWWRVSRRATLRAYEACRAHGVQREADAMVDRAIGLGGWSIGGTFPRTFGLDLPGSRGRTALAATS